MESEIELVYFVTALLFILGLKRMSSPKTARSGIVWAGGAMVLATLVTFIDPRSTDIKFLNNIELMVVAIAIGGGIAWFAGKKVPMTDMPQMVAIYNGMGGGAAGAIAAVELFSGGLQGAELFLAIVGGLIGAVAFSGSLIAFAKLQRLMTGRPITFPLQKPFNMVVFLVSLALGAILFTGGGNNQLIAVFFLMSLAFGVLMTLPIGGADMPVIISLFNALTGLAVGFEGFALGNAAMIIAGTVVGAAGTLLTQLMAKAMNRSIANVLFGAFGTEGAEAEGEVAGSLKSMEPTDAAVMMGYASKVIVVPGYGMAVAQAQHKVREMMDILDKKGIKVKFAIHPVAGRMPGHMNVLLAEAGIPYDKLFDLEEINAEFPTADVSLVIGANDVVNPAARDKASSPIYGMPILDVDKSQNVLVIKRGKGTGFAGIENELFYRDNTNMVYGDAQAVVNEIVQALKQL